MADDTLTDFYAAQPTPVITPDTLGLGPAPMAPALPQMTATQPQKRNPADLAAIALAAFLGPGKGTGILQGMHASQQEQFQRRQLQDRQAQQLFEQQQQIYEFQQRQYEQDAQRRQQALETNIKALQQTVPALKSKADYDRQIDTFTAGLQQMGLRVDGNYLRGRVPYVAKSGQKDAQDAIDLWRKNPQNDTLLKTNPDQAAQAKIPIDRDGDGVPEMITLSDAMTLAGMPFSKDESGKIIWSKPGTTAADKAGEDARYEDLKTIARAEGKDVDSNTPAAGRLRNDLRTQAIRENAQAKPKAEPDPTLQAIRELTLEQKRASGQNLPPQVQQRVLNASKAFDALPIVKRTQTMAEAVSFANSLSPNTQNPADDQALIYAFAKAMDPESVVREGEYATVQKYAQSWAQSFGFNVARVFSNSPFLSPEARQNMKATILSRYKAAKGQYDNVRRSYVQKINKVIGGPGGEDYLTDYAAGFPDEESAYALGDTTRAREKYRQRQGAK